MTRATTKGRKRVTFALDAEPGSDVRVSGTFNEWKTDGRKLVDKTGTGHFTVTVMLPKGEHQYKFLINGVWCVDPGCAEWTANDVGSLNSIVRVG